MTRYVRRSAVFLYYAIRNGMDMGSSTPVSWPSMMTSGRAARRGQAMILNRRDDSTERLLELAENIADSRSGRRRGCPAGQVAHTGGEKRLEYSLVEALPDLSDRTPKKRVSRPPRPIGSLGPLMDGTERGRRLFGEANVPAAGGEIRPC